VIVLPRAGQPPVRFLADENLDFPVVRILRGAGHDVRSLAEETSRTVDAEVNALAAREGRPRTRTSDGWHLSPR